MAHIAQNEMPATVLEEGDLVVTPRGLAQLVRVRDGGAAFDVELLLTGQPLRFRAGELRHPDGGQVTAGAGDGASRSTGSMSGRDDDSSNGDGTRGAGGNEDDDALPPPCDRDGVRLRVGSLVVARFRGCGERWYPGVVTAVARAGGGWAFSLAYDDGDAEDGALPCNVLLDEDDSGGGGSEGEEGPAPPADEQLTTGGGPVGAYDDEDAGTASDDRGVTNSADDAADAISRDDYLPPSQSLSRSAAVPPGGAADDVDDGAGAAEDTPPRDCEAGTAGLGGNGGRCDDDAYSNDCSSEPPPPLQNREPRPASPVGTASEASGAGSSASCDAGSVASDVVDVDAGADAHGRLLRVGDRVLARYRGRSDRLFPGTVAGIFLRGGVQQRRLQQQWQAQASPKQQQQQRRPPVTYFDVDYDDGDADDGLPGASVFAAPGVAREDDGVGGDKSEGERGIFSDRDSSGQRDSEVDDGGGRQRRQQCCVGDSDGGSSRDSSNDGHSWRSSVAPSENACSDGESDRSGDSPTAAHAATPAAPAAEAAEPAVAAVASPDDVSGYDSSSSGGRGGAGTPPPPLVLSTPQPRASPAAAQPPAPQPAAPTPSSSGSGTHRQQAQRRSYRQLLLAPTAATGGDDDSRASDAALLRPRGMNGPGSAADTANRRRLRPSASTARYAHLLAAVTSASEPSAARRWRRHGGDATVGTPLASAAATTVADAEAQAAVDVAALGRLGRELAALRSRARPALQAACATAATAVSDGDTSAPRHQPLPVPHPRDVSAWLLAAIRASSVIHGDAGNGAAGATRPAVPTVRSGALRDGLAAAGYAPSPTALAALRSGFRLRDGRAGGAGHAAIAVLPVVALLVGPPGASDAVLRHADTLSGLRSGRVRMRMHMHMGARV